MREDVGVREGVCVRVSEGVRVGDFVEEGDGVSVSEGLGDGVSEEVGVSVDVSEEVLVKEGLGDSVSEEVREEAPVGEGLGDTGVYETEKTGSPCAFVAMSMGLVNWRLVDVFAGTATPVDAKSRYTHWFSWPHQVRPHSEKPPFTDWACASHPLAVQHWVL